MAELEYEKAADKAILEGELAAVKGRDGLKNVLTAAGQGGLPINKKGT